MVISRLQSVMSRRTTTIVATARVRTRYVTPRLSAAAYDTVAVPPLATAEIVVPGSHWRVELATEVISDSPRSTYPTPTPIATPEDRMRVASARPIVSQMSRAP